MKPPISRIRADFGRAPARGTARMIGGPIGFDWGGGIV